MSKWFKVTATGLLLLALLLVAAVLAGQYVGERKMARQIPIAVHAMVPGTLHGTLEQGRYLYNTRGCASCHGADGSGHEVIRTSNMLVVSPNITPGHNSATTAYSTLDWVRTLRHGVKPDGRPVMIMPSEDYSRLTDADLGALIAYVRQLPPVPGRAARLDLPVAVKVMYGFGMVRDAAEMIDHSLPPPPPAQPSISVAHGAYVAQSCVGCHGASLSGGRIPGAPPEWPAPANLTPGSGSAMVRYRSADAFVAMLRSGQRPDGSIISPVMPFDSLRELNETDARALHRYLQTLPPRPAGGR